MCSTCYKSLGGGAKFLFYFLRESKWNEAEAKEVARLSNKK